MLRSEARTSQISLRKEQQVLSSRSSLHPPAQLEFHGELEMNFGENTLTMEIPRDVLNLQHVCTCPVRCGKTIPPSFLGRMCKRDAHRVRDGIITPCSFMTSNSAFPSLSRSEVRSRVSPWTGDSAFLRNGSISRRQFTSYTAPAPPWTIEVAICPPNA